MSTSYPHLAEPLDITLDDGQTVFQFPVNPSEIAIRRNRSYDTVQLVRLGEMDFPYGEKIKEISFSSFFPVAYDSSYCRTTDIPNPQTAMNQLNTWLNARQPLRLKVVPSDVNVLVTLSAHNSTFKANEPGDVYFDVTFRTWREYQVRTVSETAGDGAAAEARPDLKPVPSSYTVQSGDSLWKIAKLLLNAGSRWQEIYDLNKLTIGPDPNRIVPGQELVMPS